MALAEGNNLVKLLSDQANQCFPVFPQACNIYHESSENRLTCRIILITEFDMLMEGLNKMETTVSFFAQYRLGQRIR